jgi:hypothetical protein
MSNEPNKTLVLILGVLSCMTLIGFVWGLPMIAWALDMEID